MKQDYRAPHPKDSRGPRGDAGNGIITAETLPVLIRERPEQMPRQEVRVGRNPNIPEGHYLRTKTTTSYTLTNLQLLHILLGALPGQMEEDAFEGGDIISSHGNIFKNGVAKYHIAGNRVRR